MTNFFCINLASKKDRWQDCEKEFRRQKINVTRWDAKPLPENRRFGAGLSHREIIALAKEKNWEYVGVFEDDIEFLSEDFLNETEKILQEINEKKWYILYFGGSMGKYGKLIKEKGLKKCLQVKKMYEAHAVIYHKRFYDIYLNKHPSQYTKDTPEYYIDKKYRAFDEWLAHVVQEKYLCYVSSRMLVSQKNDFSIIENKFIKRHSRSVYKFYFYKYGFGGMMDIKENIISFIKKILIKKYR